jgi:hypothetical protein
VAAASNTTMVMALRRPTWTKGKGGKEGEVVLVACLRRTKRGGKRKGRAVSVMPFIGATGGRGRRGGPGRSPHGRERERQADKGGP